MTDIIVYLNANEDCDPNIVEFTVHPCHYKQNGNYHRQQHSKYCQVKTKKKKKKCVILFEFFFHMKPMKKQQHNNIVDLEPTSSSSFEESMVIGSVIQIDYSKTVQHKQETIGFNNRHDSKFHKSS